MRLVIDEQIWGVPELFRAFGDVVALAGRAIRPADVRTADALVVRSVTRVDQQLLAGSTIRFIGSATTGDDHVDLAYLASRDIAYANAAGCNARPVAEYVLAALCEWASRTGIELASRTLGVIGLGRIGSIVADWAEALGMRVLACDPPLARVRESLAREPVVRESSLPFLSSPDFNGLAATAAGVLSRPLLTAAEVLAAAEIVTLHVPLTREGSDATLDMVNAVWLAGMRRGAWLINTSRGEVIVESDLIHALDAGRLGGAILDVWCGEPAINPDLFRPAAIATPHVAGYSAAAHRRAAEHLAAALDAFRTHSARSGPRDPLVRDSHLAPTAAGIPSRSPGATALKQCDPAVPSETARGLVAASSFDLSTFRHFDFSPPQPTESDLDFLARLLRCVCDLPAIDAAFRQMALSTPIPAAFDAARAVSRARLELPEIRVNPAGFNGALRDLLSRLGVRLDV